MKIKLKSRGREFEIEVERCESFSSQGRGLMFRSRETNALLFDFPDDAERSIHSLFVFFQFLAIWINKEGKIVGKKIVKPFRLHANPGKPFSRLIEIPFCEKYIETINYILGNENIVGKEKDL
jgi:uncharacterized membrane protein (UPF0127 family)